MVLFLRSGTQGYLNLDAANMEGNRNHLRVVQPSTFVGCRSQLHTNEPTHSEDNMFGQALKLLRRYQGLNQSALAEKLDISRSYISELESGNRTPSLELLGRYADIFKIPVSSLVFFAEALEDKENISGRLNAAKGIIAKKIIALLMLLDADSEIEL